MCKCNAQLRTPFCGREGCRPPVPVGPKPHKDQSITLIAGGSINGRVRGFEHNGALCVAGKDGAVFITREHAKEFFGLVEPMPPSPGVIPPGATE